VQRARADAQRRDGSDTGDDDRLHLLQALGDQLDGVVDGLDLSHVGALELDAIGLVDDLRELGEVERVDVERLEGGLAVMSSGLAPNVCSDSTTSVSICSSVMWCSCGSFLSLFDELDGVWLKLGWWARKRGRGEQG